MDENGVRGIAATRWKRVVEPWRGRGLTIRSVCLRNRLQEGTFVRCKGFLAEKAKTSLVPRTAFLPGVVQFVVSQSAGSLDSALPPMTPSTNCGDSKTNRPVPMVFARAIAKPLSGRLEGKGLGIGTPDEMGENFEAE